MLLRGSKRQLRQDAARTLQPLVDQLQFPWLCPALHTSTSIRPTVTRRSTTSIDRRVPSYRKNSTSIPATPLSKPQTPLTRPDLSRSRSYAHVASDYFGHVSGGGEYIPFESSSNLQSKTSDPFPWPSQSQRSAFLELPPLDPSSPLIIPDSLRMGLRTFKTTRGVGGSLGDIHSILEACLRLGQLERASVMVRRLGEIYRSDSTDLLDAHNAYLGGIVDKLAVSEDQTLLDHMNRWFEVEMKGKGVHPDEVTFAMLLRATFFCANEKWVERSVRRLMDMTKQYGLYNEAREAALSQLTNAEAMRFDQYEPSAHKVTQAPVRVVGQNTMVEKEPMISQENDSYLQRSIQAQIQKGHGLESLRGSLKSLPAMHDLRTIAEAGESDPLKLQLQLEDDTMESAINRWRIEHEEQVKNLGIHSGLYKKSMGAVMWSWYENLLASIKHDLSNKDSFEPLTDSEITDEKSLLYLPLLQSIPPEKLAATTIVNTLQTIVGRGNEGLVQPMTRVVMSIGRAVESESLAEEVRRAHKGARAKDLPKLVRSEQHNLRVKRREARFLPTSVAPESTEWSANAHLRVGVRLVGLLMKSAEIEIVAKDGTISKVPAFDQRMEFSQGRKTGLLGLHTKVSTMLEKEPVGSAIAKHLPMVVPPLPWTSHRKGGYLKQPVSSVRSTQASVQSTEYVKLASKKGDMKHVYAALDVLGKTAWKINQGVFDVMVDVWNSGEAFADIPARDPQPHYPTNPGLTASLADRQEYSREVRRIDNEISGFHSIRCFQNFQLEVAKAYLGKRMFFPHNMDFRGRAYPIPPYLNHMGADNARGLLQFDTGKPLGEKGVFWLKVHLANLYGYDKASLKEREQFAADHLEDVHDSAENPLKGRKWWLKAEDPWQCLAACIELSNAFKSPDPTKYISHLPVHQDGTCNGLQHYAALGGDPIGAKQVNLEPGERPSDIYTAVAEMTAASIAKDAADGQSLAKILDGKITRKVVKQTVMTKVYGVTFSGARMQVLKRLEELYPGMFSDNGQALQAAGYIAKKIFGTLSIMFTGAQDIQLWLGECASRICDSLSDAQINWILSDESGKSGKEFKISPSNKKSTLGENTRFKSSVIWTTPLKMPVVQPYRETAVKQVRTNLQALSLYEPSAADPVHKRKQLQGFPPNFIHSLDATHMFMTALRCKDEGLTFAAVHDSFWTHAADVDTMNGVTRDSFIRMHSDNIIERLAAEFEARYQGSFYRAAVNASSPLGKRIKALRKSFVQKKGRTTRGAATQAKIDEILIEKRRLQLLASADPAEQAKGQAMITPGRLFEEAEMGNSRDTKEQLEATFGMKETGEILSEAREAIAGLDAETEAELEGTEILEPMNLAQEEGTEDVLVSPSTKKKSAIKESKVFVWRPLTFPPMPQRGTFDVTRLRESKYFFS